MQYMYKMTYGGCDGDGGCGDGGDGVACGH